MFIFVIYMSEFMKTVSKNLRSAGPVDDIKTKRNASLFFLHSFVFLLLLSLLDFSFSFAQLGGSL